METPGKLSIATPSDTELVISREFDAPRQLVFEAMSKHELLKRWFHGPEGWWLVECEVEPRVGGGFRWLGRGPDDAAMAARGVYREIAPPERVVNSQTFDFGCNGQTGEQLVSAVLIECYDRTTMTMTVKFPSMEALNETLSSGMAMGLSATYDRLKSVLKFPGSDEATRDR
jgi:uncharacterized protein YndB with AHSA1/START domain